MNLFEAVIFGVIEGITEFLPISSTGHLTIVEKLLGYQVNDPGVTAFTAVIQVGAVLATLLYFRKDIWNIGVAWCKGVVKPELRSDPNYRFGWAVILGSLPIAVVGLLFKETITGTLRSLWVVAISLIVWSGVMWLADRTATLARSQKDATWRDTLIIGLMQCIALIPGISRSGATMSAGLLRGFDRVTATKLAFFLAIPALLAAGLQQAISEYQAIDAVIGWPATITATIVSFIVAYTAVAWLLRYIGQHSYQIFIVYRLVLAAVLIVLLTTGTIEAV